ncbi:predicted protein [Nematostella vectensis]|uniref:Coup-like 1 transcription factor n=2 Tax=Nematostella vectensis TaxID=45351 RepID=A7S1X5_NEMVE|nr:coup-like 1 transcription factor [Nematostella vectensis]EDO42315.1 predicted protein [Nematostella vectensis]|eukprot:XP_001634378.1 predicted protein [Nematostella vectensis]
MPKHKTDERVACAVCGDKSTGKHYGVSTCEGCKSFFKRTVRNNTNYTCRGQNTCAIDRNSRSRCPSCRFQKCLSTGMKKEAVQTTKLPPFPALQFPFYGDVNTMYAQTMFPLTLFQSPFNAPLTFPMGMVPLNQNRTDVAYELAANVLFAVVDWARKLTTFNNLMDSDQITLLKMAWTDLFLLEASRSPLQLYVQQMYATINAQTKQLSMEVIVKRMEYARLFQEQAERIRNLGMDMTEHFHLKCIVLFRADGSLINQPRQVEVLQDTSQSSLEQYIRSQYPSQPTRFGKLLLMLSSLRKVESTVIEQLFFADVLRGASMGEVLKKMLTTGNQSPTTLAAALANGKGSPMS